MDATRASENQIGMEVADFVVMRPTWPTLDGSGRYVGEDRRSNGVFYTWWPNLPYSGGHLFRHTLGDAPEMVKELSPDDLPPWDSGRRAAWSLAVEDLVALGMAAGPHGKNENGA